MNDSFYVQGQKPAEDKRLKNGVPYTSVADANATIPKKDRYMTLEVGIRIAGVTFIYWWKDGLEDYNLVLKEDGSGSGNLPSVLIFKDVVPTVADLDTISNPETGWVYGVESDGALYVYIKDYNGQIGNNIWKNLGVAVDLRDYVKNSDLTTALNGYAKKDGSNLTLPTFRDNLNIQVSATNLAKNSKGLVNSNSYWIRDVESTKVLESGKTYTVKVWTKTVNQNTNAYFSLGDQTGHLVNLTKISPTEFVGKVVMPRDSNGNLVLFRQPNDSSFYQFEAIKIVEGDMITKDWSPSPDDAAPVNFITQGEAESTTAPSVETNKAVSNWSLWKWWQKAIQYLFLQPTTANTTPNKDWSDGLVRWFTNKDGVNKQFLFDGDIVRRIDGTFNPPTQAQMTTLGLKRGDYYQCTTTMQRAIYNGQQLIEWTVTTTEFNAMSADQKNAVKNLSVSI